MSKKSPLIGKKFVLWRRERQDEAYKDQFGIGHPAIVVLDEVTVTVTETREVGGDYRPAEKHDGLKAVSADGREFRCNWELYPDASTTPTFFWSEDHTSERWVDACQQYGNGELIITKDLTQRAVPTGATICRIHGYADLPPDTCMSCAAVKRAKGRKAVTGAAIFG